MMKLNSKVLFVAAAILSSISCSKGDLDQRFSDDPLSKIDTPRQGNVQKNKENKWDFTSTEGWVTANQGDNANNNNSSIEDCADCSNKKALKIYTQANTHQRQKLKTKKRFGGGLYTWRTYISDLGIGERASIGSWIWNSDKHELDFEVGSGTSKERKELGLADDEVIAYITSQANPYLHQKVRIKKNAWHTFQIDLKMIGRNYLASWMIDGVKYAEQQLKFGQEYPFHIFCSTENLKFVGDSTPTKDNYGLWDYVTYQPYPYSIDPAEPSKQQNPIDAPEEPDAGKTVKWFFNSMPAAWKTWTNVGADGAAFNKIAGGKLVLGGNGYCKTSKIEYASQVGYGKYTWAMSFPEVKKALKFQAGGTFYSEVGGEKAITIMAWYGPEEERKRLGAKENQLLLRVYSGNPSIESYVAVLDPNKEYRLGVELKNEGGVYKISFFLDDKLIPNTSVTANYGADAVKFAFITSMETNRGWMPGEAIGNKPDDTIEAKVNYIEYTAY